MGTFPCISKNKGLVELSFGNIPVWNGVQKIAGVQKCLPMRLSTNQSPIVQCESLQVINDVVTKYEADDYMFLTPPPGSSNWANSLGESRLKVVEEVIDGGVLPRNILEIGAGSTWIANKLQEKYNPDSYVITDPAIKETSGRIEIIREYFPSKKTLDRRFDLIIGFSVLEHVPDPVLFLANIKKHLTSNGMVILVYPNCETQMLRGDINVLIHEHLTYFTYASSRWLASTCVFEVRSLRSGNDIFALVLSRDLKGVREKILLDESKLLIKSAESFRCSFEKLKNKVVECLKAGQTVGFHGATNGLNICLHMAGLGDDPNIYIYDGDRSKEDFYLPACSSPIRSPVNGDYSSHSLIVVSAMSFFEQISRFAIDEAGVEKPRLFPLVGLEPVV